MAMALVQLIWFCLTLNSSMGQSLDNLTIINMCLMSSSNILSFMSIQTRWVGPLSPSFRQDRQSRKKAHYTRIADACSGVFASQNLPKHIYLLTKNSQKCWGDFLNTFNKRVKEAWSSILLTSFVCSKT